MIKPTMCEKVLQSICGGKANQVEFVRTIVHQKAELNTKDFACMRPNIFNNADESESWMWNIRRHSHDSCWNEDALGSCRKVRICR